jgi:BirA family transcriptional regulator, biotin operon repressor / biotin---[acetyl-CoA-carboxylase] ligase
MIATHRLPDDIAEAVSRSGHRLWMFADRLHWYFDVPSTNDVAAMLAESGAAEGTVVAADAQSAGRGRLGRHWSSPRGAGLYVSIVLRPRPEAAALLTLAAGVAVCEAIRAATGLTPDLKWPNDALIAGRKVAGILAEAGTTWSPPSDAIVPHGLPHVVLGIGINVGQAAYPADIAATATSIEAELGRPVDRGLVCAELLNALAIRYTEIQEGATVPVLEAWRRFGAVTLRRMVEWETGEGPHRGIARDIDHTGALLVETPDGSTRLIAGAVRWV